MQSNVLVVEEPAAWQRTLAAHLAVARIDSAHHVVRLLVPEGDRKLLHELGARGRHERQFADGIDIGDRQPHALAGALAARLRAGLPHHRDRDAVAECAGEAGFQRRPETVTVGEQHDDRDDAPRDAEHRQGGAEPVVVEPDKRLHHDVGQHAD